MGRRLQFLPTSLSLTGIPRIDLLSPAIVEGRISCRGGFCFWGGNGFFAGLCQMAAGELWSALKALDLGSGDLSPDERMFP
jgi:hypothetical protein